MERRQLLLGILALGACDGPAAVLPALMMEAFVPEPQHAAFFERVQQFAVSHQMQMSLRQLNPQRGVVFQLLGATAEIIGTNAFDPNTYRIGFYPVRGSRLDVASARSLSDAFGANVQAVQGVIYRERESQQ